MKQIHRGSRAMLLALVATVLWSACADNVRAAAPGESQEAQLEEARQEVRAAANETLQMLYRHQPQARRAIKNAAGYAVFSNFGMKILLAGGGSGKGVAVNNKTRQEVFMRMAEVQAGLGFGVKKFRIVWVFETQQAFNSFVNSGYQFGGQATLAAKAGSTGGGVAGAASVAPGVWVYQITSDGVAAELTVKGTKYYRDKDLN